MRRRPLQFARRGALWLTGAVVFALSAGATVPATTDLLNAQGNWMRLDVPNQPPAEFSFSASGELTVKADKSVAFLYRAVVTSPGDADQWVKWRWRVDRSFPSTDLGAKGKDDRPLAVHLWFADDREASVFGPLGWLFGYPHISHTITYVLGGDHPADSMVTNPYYDNGVIYALRGRHMMARKWYSEMRDIRSDLARAFPGRSIMRTLKYISVSADTDDTASRSLARIAGLRMMQRSRR